MAQRRMFSPNIVKGEEFLSMPMSSQLLYFHLGMDADDDGFVQPKIVMRVMGAADDDLKVLLAKRFLLPFESGVVVIKHWLIHNLIQKDRYRRTRFQEEKSRLFIKENKAYTENLDSVNILLTQVRLGKDRLPALPPSEAAEGPSHHEVEERVLVGVDDEGNEDVPAARPKTKSEKAESDAFKSFVKRFQDRCVQKGLPRPIVAVWMRQQMLKNIKEAKLTQKHSAALMEEWFAGDRKDSDMINIAYAFGARNINDYKARNSLK